jgi:hypothetical protein
MSGRGIKISVSELGGEIDRQLTIYGESINEGIRREVENSIKALVKETKATAPVGKRKKHYRDSISAKCIRNTYHTKAIWYVKGPDYRLSHLLENGHALRDGGRVEGTHFIQKATDPILEQYLKAVEEVIKNG